MIEQLFGSKTRVKLLQLFMSNPNRPFYVREITRKIDEQINSVRRELANLLSIGIITSDNNNNRLYYEVNQKYPYFDALGAIFAGKKVSAVSSTKKSTKKKDKSESVDEIVESVVEEAVLDNPILKRFRKTGNISLLLLTGKFTRDPSSGADILIVGDVNMVQVEKEIAELEKTENKELLFAVFKPSEFIYRKQINDRFITNILASKHQVLINSEELL